MNIKSKINKKYLHDVLYGLDTIDKKKLVYFTHYLIRFKIQKIKDKEAIYLPMGKDYKPSNSAMKKIIEDFLSHVKIDSVEMGWNCIEVNCTDER